MKRTLPVIFSLFLAVGIWFSSVLPAQATSYPQWTYSNPSGFDVLQLIPSTDTKTLPPPPPPKTRIYLNGKPGPSNCQDSTKGFGTGSTDLKSSTDAPGTHWNRSALLPSGNGIYIFETSLAGETCYLNGITVAESGYEGTVDLASKTGDPYTGTFWIPQPFVNGNIALKNCGTAGDSNYLYLYGDPETGNVSLGPAPEGLQGNPNTSPGCPDHPTS